MNEILFRLLAIAEMCKELHYRFIRVYELHLLYDRFYDDVKDERDALNEAMLAEGLEVPTASENLGGAMALIPDEVTWETLKEVVDGTLAIINGYDTGSSRGLNKVLDDIAGKLFDIKAFLQ